MELYGIQYLRDKLRIKQPRVGLRYDYYDMKHTARDLGISTPPQLKWWNRVMGWCGTAVDSVADRLIFRGFSDDAFNVGEIFETNNADVLTDSAVLSALISSCSFIYISPDASGYPQMQVIDGANATGNINPITGMLYEGYAVLEKDDKDRPTLEAYFEPGRTTYYDKDGKVIRVDNFNLDYPLLVPIVYKPDAKRPFGHSRITRACMDLQDSAARTLKRSEISAEFYSFPQKWVTGLDPDAEQLSSWKSAMSAMLRFDQDERGERPQVGQFLQQSMTPHADQLRMFASAFAGETGLTLDDLGFVSQNPSSSEAIKASHDRLRLIAEKAKRGFGMAFLNAGFLAACLRDSQQYDRVPFFRTKVLWEPTFAPDAASLSGIGDAINKLSLALPGYITEDKVRDMTGI